MNRERGAVGYTGHVVARKFTSKPVSKPGGMTSPAGAPLSRSARVGQTGRSPLVVTLPHSERREILGVAAGETAHRSARVGNRPGFPDGLIAPLPGLAGGGMCSSHGGSIAGIPGRSVAFVTTRAGGSRGLPALSQPVQWQAGRPGATQRRAAWESVPATVGEAR